MQDENRDSRLLSVAIDDGNVLRAAYMPFVRNGGLFVPTSGRYRLGDEVFVLLRVMGNQRSIPLAGKVVWITPPGAVGGRPAGVGVQLGEHDDLVRQTLADCLADYPDNAESVQVLEQPGCSRSRAAESPAAVPG